MKTRMIIFGIFCACLLVSSVAYSKQDPRDIEDVWERVTYRYEKMGGNLQVDTKKVQELYFDCNRNNFKNRCRDYSMLKTVVIIRSIQLEAKRYKENEVPPTITQPINTMMEELGDLCFKYIKIPLFTKPKLNGSTSCGVYSALSFETVHDRMMVLRHSWQMSDYVKNFRDHLVPYDFYPISNKSGKDLVLKEDRIWYPVVKSAKSVQEKEEGIVNALRSYFH